MEQTSAPDPTASVTRGDGTPPIVPGIHAHPDTEISMAKEDNSNNLTSMTVINADPAPAPLQPSDAQTDELHDQRQLDATQTQHVPTTPSIQHQMGLLVSPFAPPPDLLNAKSVISSSANSFIVPGEIGAAGHGKPIRSVRGRSHRAGILALGARAAPAAPTLPTEPHPTETSSAAVEHRPSQPSSDPLAPSLPHQELQLSSSASTSPAPVRRTAAKRASSAPKIKTARRISGNSQTAADTSNSSTSRRVMPARLRHIGDLLEGSSLEAELAGVLGNQDASGSGDHAFTLPPETGLFITTEAEEYMPLAREDKEVASNYRSYFDNEEVQRACRERAEIETPEYENWDEMEFKGRKRFFEPTTDLSLNAYRALQRTAVMREKRQRKLERDRIIKERNKIVDRIESLKAKPSKHFFPIVRARGTLTSVITEDGDAMEEAAEEIRQVLVAEATATLTKYDGAIAHAAIGLEAVLGERDEGGDGSVTHPGSGIKLKPASAGMGLGRHGRVTADRSQEAESSKAARRPRYVESSTEQSDAESSHTPFSTRAPIAKRPRKSEPVRTARAPLSRRSASIGVTPQPESEADKRTESVRRNNPRAASIQTAARITAQYAKGKGRAFDDDFEEDEDDTSEQAATEEVRPKARPTVKASARREGIQRERDLILACPLDIPFRTFNNAQADPPRSPAFRIEIPTTRPVPAPATSSPATSPTRNRMSIESIINHPRQPPAAAAPNSNPIALAEHVAAPDAESSEDPSGPRLNPMSVAYPTVSEDHLPIPVEAPILRENESSLVAEPTHELNDASAPKLSVAAMASNDLLMSEKPASAVVNPIEPNNLDMADAGPAAGPTFAELVRGRTASPNTLSRPLPSSGRASTTSDSSASQLRVGSLICVDVPPRPEFHTLLLWGCFRFTSASIGKDATPEEIRQNLGQWTEEEWDEREFGDQDAAERSPEEIRDMLIYGWNNKSRTRPLKVRGIDAVESEESGANVSKDEEDIKVHVKGRAAGSAPVKWETVQETHLHKVGPSLLELSETHIEYAAQMEAWEAEARTLPVDQEKPPQPEWELVLREVCSRRHKAGRAGRGPRSRVKAEGTDKAKAPASGDEVSQRASSRATRVTQKTTAQEQNSPKTPTRATRSTARLGEPSNDTSPRPQRMLSSIAAPDTEGESLIASEPGPQTVTSATADVPAVSTAPAVAGEPSIEAIAAAPALNYFSNWTRPTVSLAPCQISSSTLYLSDDSTAGPSPIVAAGSTLELLPSGTPDLAATSETVAASNGDAEPQNNERVSSQTDRESETVPAGVDLISLNTAEEHPASSAPHGASEKVMADQAEPVALEPSSTSPTKPEALSRRASPSKRQAKIKMAVGTRSSSSRLKTLSAFGEKPPLTLLEKDAPFDRLAEYKLNKWGYLTYVDAGDPSVSVTAARGAYSHGTAVGSDSGSGRWRALMEVAREREREWLERLRVYDAKERATVQAAPVEAPLAVSSMEMVEPANAAAVEEGSAAGTMRLRNQGTSEAQG